MFSRVAVSWPSKWNVYLWSSRPARDNIVADIRVLLATLNSSLPLRYLGFQIKPIGGFFINITKKLMFPIGYPTI